MAHKDYSQGHAFVYVDIEQLLLQRDALLKSPMHPQQKTAQTVNFNKDRVSSIQENFDKIQKMHHKLYTILSDIKNKKK